MAAPEPFQGLVDAVWDVAHRMAGMVHYAELGGTCNEKLVSAVSVYADELKAACRAAAAANRRLR